jgi:hypothetical protein
VVRYEDMKKGRQVFLLVVTLLATTALPVSADSTVNISSNTTGSNSHVEVHDTTNTTNTNTSENSGYTSVRIETNGNVKTYESDTPGSVHIESDDGTAKVDINNGSSTGTTLNNTQKQELRLGQKQATEDAQKKIDETEKKVKQKLQDEEQKRKGIIERIEDFIINIFQNLKV